MSHSVKTYVHARLDNTQIEPNFGVTACKLRHRIASQQPENTVLTVNNQTDDLIKKPKQPYI